MEARHAVDALLEATGSAEEPRSAADSSLNLWNDRPALHAACVKLSERAKEKSLDVILRARITAMVGVLNLYLNSELGYSWRKASLVVAKARDQGITHARNLRKWILDFIRSDQLPLHRYGQLKWSVLEDEDISQSLQLQLSDHARRGLTLSHLELILFPLVCLLNQIPPSTLCSQYLLSPQCLINSLL